MDTSETYIKMCDCPEIQEEWKSGDLCKGDFYFSRDRHGRPTSVVDIYDGKGWALLPRDVNFGWLPRQDQIQEMAGGLSPDKTGYSQLLHDFFQFIEFNEIRYIKSFEQLWLAFYMHEKHGKVWDGEKWVKKEG